MKKLIFLITLIFVFSTSVFAAERFDPANTYTVICGVLSWQDKGLSTYSTKNRKDLEFYNLLLKLGVPAENMSILLDKQATLDEMKTALKETAQKAGKDSTIIFYYAGHGIKEKDGQVYFANYDINASSNIKNTGFNTSLVSKILSKNYKGQNVFLFADCCYSGMLSYEAAKLSASGFKAAFLTSAIESNSSTSNWTFTQTMIDCFSGQKIADRDNNGKITLNDAKKEVFDAMKYRENQKCGSGSFGIADDFVIADASGEAAELKNSPFSFGQYVKAIYYGGRWLPARIVGSSEGGLLCEFYFYTDKVDVPVKQEKIKKFVYKSYSLNQKVKVLWGGKLYDAQILKKDDDFYYVTYPGWAHYWDEWVMDASIVENKGIISVEWQGQWYPAQVVKKNNGKYFIHYIGYDSTWDEWVDNKRIKF